MQVYRSRRGGDESMKQFAFCRVCRQNQNQGKGHKYAVKHKQNLSQWLSKARKKIQEIRFFIKEVSPLQDEGRSRNKFWCHFCEQDIDEKQSLFACENAIQHLASSTHTANLKSFWSENGADAADRHFFSISNEDLVKWKERCKASLATAARACSLEQTITNNIHSDTCPVSEGLPLGIGGRQSVSHVVSKDDVHPLSVLTLRDFQNTNGRAYSVATSSRNAEERTERDSNGWHQPGETVQGRVMHQMDSVSCQTHVNTGIEATSSISSHASYSQSSSEVFHKSAGGGSVENREVLRGGLQSIDWHGNAQISSLSNASSSRYSIVVSGQNLASIGPTPLQPGEGNVHSGATPPWLQPSDDRKLYVAGSGSGPPIKQVLSRTQERKLAKLRPPNRVGAAWAEMRRAQIAREQNGESNEVVQEADASWLPNFGRVWQSGSRLDTKKEYETERRREAKRLGKPLGTRGAAENSVHFQPYVSKRQRVNQTKEQSS